MSGRNFETVFLYNAWDSKKISPLQQNLENQDSNSMSIIDEVVRQVICEDQVDGRVDLVESR